MKKIMKKAAAVFLTAALATGLCACAGTVTVPSVGDVGTQAQKTGEEITTYTIGIYNYLNDKTVDTVVENIRKQLEALGEENNVHFDVIYEYCDADPEVLDQVVAGYVNKQVDLVIGVATPAAKTVEILTRGMNIPVIFAALSDPEGAGLVRSGISDADVTGALDYVDTNAVLNLIFTNTPAETIDSVTLAVNGAFENYGADYANLGIEAANMAKSILVDGNNPANVPVLSLENGTVDVSEQFCELFGFSRDEVKGAFESLIEGIGNFQ